MDGYESVKVDKPDTELTDAEFEAELDRIRDSRSRLETVTEDRSLADGDWALITFTGELENGNIPAAGRGINSANTATHEGKVSVEIGGKDTLPAFSDALRSAKPGQELKFEVTYPGDFGQKRLAGKTVAYHVEVRGIQKKVQPELNDEFAKELGEYESLEDFKEKLREHLAADNKAGC